jgi:hypothetical protein
MELALERDKSRTPVSAILAIICVGEIAKGDYTLRDVWRSVRTEQFGYH